MKEETAKSVVDTLVRVFDDLNRCVAMMKGVESAEDFERYGDSISRAMTVLLVEVMNRACYEHPHLTPHEMRKGHRD